VGIAECTQTAEQFFACAPHLFPSRVGIEYPDAFRQRATTAQCCAQVVHRTGAEVFGRIVAADEHLVHPVLKAGSRHDGGRSSH
jgi:hypothetical protein